MKLVRAFVKELALRIDSDGPEVWRVQWWGDAFGACSSVECESIEIWDDRSVRSGGMSVPLGFFESMMMARARRKLERAQSKIRAESIERALRST